MKTAKLQMLILTGLSLAFVSFVILSWWLLFRDPRALLGIGKFYPFLRDSLTSEQLLLTRFGLNLVPTLIFALVTLVAFGAYFLSLKTTFSLKQSVIWSVAFALIVFVSYPVLSTDIFSYVFTDRVATVHQQNTWTVTPDHFKSDPFEIMADWKDQTKVYGYVEQISYLPAQYLGGNDLFKVILFYKLTALTFYLATLALVVKLTCLFFRSDEERAVAFRTLFWNPLFVLEMIGSAHNDIIMLCFLVLSLVWWKQKKWVLAGVALALSVQVKLITGIWFGFSFLYLLTQKQWRAALEYAASFSVLNVAAFILMGLSPLDFLSRVLYNNAVFWQSLPSLLHLYWPGEKLVFGVALMLSLFALVVLQIWKKTNPLLLSASMLLIYLLFFATAYWNWYVVWVLIWVPFLKQAWLRKAVLLFSLTSLLAYPLLWLSQRYDYHNQLWPVLYYALILGIPTVSAALLLIKVKYISLTK